MEKLKPQADKEKRKVGKQIPRQNKEEQMAGAGEEAAGKYH